MIKNKIQIIPNGLNFSLFVLNKTYWMYLYNKKYSIFLKISLELKIISSQCLIIKKKQNFIHNYNSILQKYFVQIQSFDYVKIKFSGKGYKIKKTNNKHLVLLFNRAHITHLWWRCIFLKKLKKYKIYIKYTYLNKNIINTILGIRNINIFTKKGLRKSKQILFKKKGKK